MSGRLGDVSPEDLNLMDFCRLSGDLMPLVVFTHTYLCYGYSSCMEALF